MVPSDDLPITRPVLFAFLTITNLLGIGLVLLFVTVAIPAPNVFAPRVAWISEEVAPVYVVAAIALGWLWMTRRILGGLRWKTGDQPLTAADQRNAFLAPWRLALVPVILWMMGACLFAALFGSVSYSYVPKLVFGISFSGMILSASCYFFAELMLRPAAAVALEAGRPTRRFAPGVMGRSTVSWLLGSGGPLIAIVAAVLFTLSQTQMTVTEQGLIVLLLGVAAFVFGLVSNLIAAWLTATSVRVVSLALQRVEAGDLDCRLEVFDGSEVGELQRGFNAMVEGLRQRERVRDLFGRHVGRDVAAAAEQQQAELGGEERHVAILFVDIIGSTRLVTSKPPAEVVGLLNRLFTAIVEEVNSRQGLINKFQGDGTLVVFGAPVRAASPESDALETARAIAQRLAAEVPECQVGIGVAAGTVLAGNVGAYERFEYTVIGEPVNVAARLCELAKADPHHILASAEAVQASAPRERLFWEVAKQAVLRGLDRPRQLARPRAATHEWLATLSQSNGEICPNDQPACLSRSNRPHQIST
ncbi:hypothetical protein BST12_17950 [Mycobacterium angelicum]|uniref:Adenylate/guanylate cyclase domain-containing protein n=1 Tax=Mycobacterium angelicum TaxID=470074 RepID=A0A1W9ZMN6_MYCAN|nr:hypothetical protein BST12_17950 [Mycobacterium angelicum]